ncbi:MAG: HipA domain-containing protein [Clostridium sp.]|nr:HipA domain-containing protein [Eubacterium sp.]MCM1181648.1 HipA domain-containing protein [Clostridium sp.]
MVDFTECRRIFAKAYNGANGKKIAVEYAGEQYMLKFPASGKEKPTELSYTNSCISEHIASSVFNMLGISAQQTLLGIYRVNGKEKIVCACKDFTAGGKILYDFCSIKNSVIDSEHNGSGTELADILETIEKQQFVNPAMLLGHFWNVFVVDALLGNFDRHNGNWGFLVDPVSQTAELAPVYDCGSCLLPQADEKVMLRVLENEAELNARVYQFPTSAIKQTDRKINYHDFLMNPGYQECDEALLRIVPRIDIGEITAFVEQVQSISELQKRFYKTYLSARYDKMIKPAYGLALKRLGRDEE